MDKQRKRIPNLPLEYHVEKQIYLMQYSPVINTKENNRKIVY
jgi:hypothetical protein